MLFRCCAWVVVLLVAMAGDVRGQDQKPAKVRVLLLGDSTVIGSVCREMHPKTDHLEDVVRKLLAAETDLPAVEVVNRGQNGDMIHQLLARRYEKDVAGQAPFDFIFIRYGLNDVRHLKDFKTEFPANFKTLLSRLRADHPKAEIVLETVIPYLGAERDDTINEQVRLLAKEEKLPLIDQYAPYNRPVEERPEHAELSADFVAGSSQKVSRPDSTRSDQR